MGKTILLADKSVTIQKIVELTFADEDYVIKSVTDGQAALDLIAEVHPDLILADLNLPLKDGYEVCRLLRTSSSLSSFAKIPVILLAGIYETMDEDRAKQVEERVREVGANGYLSKPFDPQVLIEKVKELLERTSSGITASVEDTSPGLLTREMFSVDETPTEAMTKESFIQRESPEETKTTETSEEEVPEDSEKTMMLSGPPSFGMNMFAETPPFEETPVSQEPAVSEETRTMKLDFLLPKDEPYTEEVSATTQEFQVPDPTEPEIEAPHIAESLLETEESQFTLDTMPEAAEEESVFDTKEVQEAASSPTLIVQTPDEPFGDVFQDALVQAQWSSQSDSEEESPFGLPESPTPSEEPPSTVLETEIASADQEWGADTFIEEPAPTGSESVQEESESLETEPILKTDITDDAWLAENVTVEPQQPVDDLFENEPESTDVSPKLEEQEDLQPDLSEGSFVLESFQEPAAESIEPISQAPATASAPIEITDELVQRIVDKVLARLSEQVVSEIVWQVVPDLAEKMIRRELEKLHAGDD